MPNNGAPSKGLNTQNDASQVPIRYLIGGVVSWLIGIQFIAGWHYATVGQLNYVVSAGQAVVVVILWAILSVLTRRSKIRSSEISFGIGVAMGAILIGGGFPIGAVFGGIWNSIGGSFPDMSEHHNRMSLLKAAQVFASISGLA